jgi:hypothetical protein
MFCFDKLCHLSKSVHTRENSQILTVSNKKIVLKIFIHHSFLGAFEVEGDSTSVHRSQLSVVWRSTQNKATPPINGVIDR